MCAFARHDVVLAIEYESRTCGSRLDTGEHVLAYFDASSTIRTAKQCAIYCSKARYVSVRRCNVLAVKYGWFQYTG